MKLESIKIGAVIPVQQYGNIQPEITISSDDKGEDLINAGMDVIKNLFGKYSEKGGLTEKEVTELVTVSISKKSFNEDVVVQFNEKSHSYLFEDKKLTAVTDIVKKYYKEFDTENISKALEKNWGVPQEVIKSLWNSNGDTTRGLGDIIHKALEEFEKFKDIGDVISSKKGDEHNYALPKHPLIRPIIEGFIKINPIKGEVKVEQLVSNVELGICGHADRIVIIDWKKKICRVGDYKVNINSEDIDKNYKIISDDEIIKSLPANKISKYQIQLSIYANLLQKSGWTVEGLDVYVLENEWKYFPLEVLQVLK